MGQDAEDVNLWLDIDSVKDRAGVHSSLTDINRISVFTDRFGEEKAAVEEEHQAAKEELYDTVFVCPFGNGAETELTDLMFLEKTEESPMRSEQETVKSQSWHLTWIIFAAVILLAGAFLLYNKRSEERKRQYDADNQPEATA